MSLVYLEAGDLMKCPDCGKKLYDKIEEESGFTERICWVCGYYESDSEAYKSYPEHFRNMLRRNPKLLNRTGG